MEGRERTVRQGRRAQARRPRRALQQQPLCEGVQTAVPRARSLVPLASPQEGPVVEHVLRHGVERPEVPLAGVARLPRHLDEAVV